MAPFRSDLEALEARHAALAAEAAEKVRARDEAAQMLAEARARQRPPMRGVYDPVSLQRRRVAATLVGMALALITVTFMMAATVQMSRKHEWTQHGARVMQQLEAFAAQMCACPDAACTRAVSEAVSRWGDRELSRGPGLEIDPHWQARGAALLARMDACVSAQR